MKRNKPTLWESILLVIILFMSCKTTRHVQKEKQAIIQTQTTDRTANEGATTQTTEKTESTWIRDVDTTIHPKPIKGKATVSANKSDTTAIYDSLGNKLGIVASSFDSLKNALNLTFTAQPEPVHVKIHESGTNKSQKDTKEDKHKDVALHSQSNTETRTETVNKDIVRKTDVWAWIKWIALAGALLALILNYRRIWDWLKRRVKK